MISIIMIQKSSNTFPHHISSIFITLAIDLLFSLELIMNVQKKREAINNVLSYNHTKNNERNN